MGVQAPRMVGQDRTQRGWLPSVAGAAGPRGHFERPPCTEGCPRLLGRGPSLRSSIRRASVCEEARWPPMGGCRPSLGCARHAARRASPPASVYVTSRSAGSWPCAPRSRAGACRNSAATPFPGNRGSVRWNSARPHCGVRTQTATLGQGLRCAFREPPVGALGHKHIRGWDRCDEQILESRRGRD